MKTIQLLKRLALRNFIWISVGFVCISPAKANDLLPKNIRSIRIDSGPSLLEKLEKETIPKVVFRGSDARHQYLITGTDSTGLDIDLTRNASYRFEPEGIASIDRFGQIAPLKNGSTTLSASLDGVASALLQVEVTNWDDNPEVNFPNQVVPIFTKLGCNGGGCHGKAAGQNGFKLSLLGFEPSEDFEHLVKESRGRRLSTAMPDSSLLLTKSINAVQTRESRIIPAADAAGC